MRTHPLVVPLGADPDARRLSSSLAFDGSSGYVTLPDQPALDFGASATFTIACWVKLTAGASVAGGWQTPLAKGGISPGSAAGFAFQYRQSSPSLQATLCDGSGTNFTQTVLNGVELRDSRWHHWCAAVDRPNRLLTLYLDGAQQAQASIPAGLGSLASSADLRLGASTAFNQYTAGSVATARVWTVVLTPAQIQALAQGSVPRAGLVLELLLAEGGGTTIRDSSGAGYSASLTGGVSWSSDSPPNGA